MKLTIEMEGRLRDVELERLVIHGIEQSGLWRGTIDGEPVVFEVHQLSSGVLSLIVGNTSYRAVLENGSAEPALNVNNHWFPYRVDDPRSLRSRRSHGAGADGPKAIKASMPGRVVRVLVQKGDEVQAHQSVVVIEAMKMQNELKSPKTGHVSEVRVVAGDTVASGEVLAVVD